MTYRRGSLVPKEDPADPVALAKALPKGLRSFDAFMDSSGGGPAPGLVQYQRALRRWLEDRVGLIVPVDDDLVSEVQNAALGPSSTSDWFKRAFGIPVLKVVE